MAWSPYFPLRHDNQLTFSCHKIQVITKQYPYGHRDCMSLHDTYMLLSRPFFDKLTHDHYYFLASLCRTK